MMDYHRIAGCLALLLSMYACKEETRVNEVQGFAKSDCFTPIANTEVAFKINPIGSFSETIIVASDVTDQNGYFRFTYELEEDRSGSADLIAVGESSYQTILENVPLGRDHELQAYLQNRSDLIFEIITFRLYQPTDTLFYGIEGGEEYRIIQPEAGDTDTIFSRNGNAFEASLRRAFYFGVGSPEFSLAKEALGIQDSAYNHIYFDIGGCEEDKTFTLLIN